jgi:hypothetical protein
MSFLIAIMEIMSVIEDSTMKLLKTRWVRHYGRGLLVSGARAGIGG